MITTTSKGWKIDRVRGVEVYTAPDGGEFVRAAGPEMAEVAIQLKSAGLSPLYLQRKSVEAIVKAAERKERSQERRETARRNRRKGA